MSDSEAQPSEQRAQDHPDAASSEQNAESWLDSDIEVDPKKAVLGGLLATAVILLGTVSVGRLTGAEGRVLLQATLPSIRFLCSSAMTALSTILALMLTLLGLSYRSDIDLSAAHYKRIHQIAFVDAITFVLAALFLLLVTVPVEKTDAIPTGWFNTVYYIVISTAAILGGLLISVVLMLYDAVRDMIFVVGIGPEKSPLGPDPEDDSN